MAKTRGNLAVIEGAKLDTAALQERIKKASRELSALPNVQIDPGPFVFSSELEAVKRLLIEKGLTDIADLQARSLEVQAERLERAVMNAKRPRVAVARA